MRRAVKMLVLVFLLTITINVHAACANLKNVKIDGTPISKGAIANSDGTAYKIIIKDNIKTLTISAETDYVFVEGYAPRTVSTNAPVQIKVNGAPDCGITTYLFTFVKESQTTTTKNISTEPISTTAVIENSTTTTTSKKVEQEEITNEVKLKRLTIDGYYINFSPDVLDYMIEIPEEITALKIYAEAYNENDSILVSENSNNLIEETNIVTITVKNAEIEKTYNLTVLKKNPSSNNYLSQLSISGYSIPFDPDIGEYTLTIKNEKSLNISAVTQDLGASVSILNNDALVNGSNIIVIVTAANGSEREYLIKITKKESSFMSIISDYWIYLVIGVIAVIIVIVLIIILLKRKKKNNTVEPDKITVESENVSMVGNSIDASPPQIDNAVLQNNNMYSVQQTKTEEKQILDSGLEIVSPQSEESKSNEETSNTEIFKL